MWRVPGVLSYHVCVKSLSRVRLFATPWTVACQAPLSIGFSRQEYWNGLPFPSPGDLPDPGIELESLRSLALAGGFFTTSAISLVVQTAKNLPAMQFDLWVQKIPWGREWQPTPVFLPGKSLGQRNRAGYSPWGHKESDVIERLCLIIMS